MPLSGLPLLTQLAHLGPTCLQLIEELAEEAALLLEAAGYVRISAAAAAVRDGVPCALRVLQDPSTGGHLVVGSQATVIYRSPGVCELDWRLTAEPTNLDELGLAAWVPSAHALAWSLACDTLNPALLTNPVDTALAVETALLTAWARQNAREGHWSPSGRMRWLSKLEEWLRP